MAKLVKFLQRQYLSIRQRVVLPPVCPAVVVPYQFWIWRRDFINLFFIGTAVLIPLSLTITQTFIGPHFLTWRVWLSLTSIGTGLIYFLIKGHFKALLRSGAIGFYFYAFIPILFSFPTQLIHQNWFKLVVNIFASSMIAGLVMFFSPELRTKIRLTFTNPDSRFQFLDFLFYFFIGLCVIGGFNLIQQLINSTPPANEQELDSLSSSWTNDLLLVVLVLLVAPVTEELVARHALIQLTGRSGIGFWTSILWFGELHISQNADWIHIFSYLGGGLALTMIFLVFNCNVVFSIAAHMGFNLIALVPMS